MSENSSVGTRNDAGKHRSKKWSLEPWVYFPQTFEYQTVVGHCIQNPRQWIH